MSRSNSKETLRCWAPFQTVIFNGSSPCCQLTLFRACSSSSCSRIEFQPHNIKGEMKFWLPTLRRSQCRRGRMGSPRFREIYTKLRCPYINLSNHHLVFYLNFDGFLERIVRLFSGKECDVPDDLLGPHSKMLPAKSSSHFWNNNAFLV